MNDGEGSNLLSALTFILLTPTYPHLLWQPVHEVARDANTKLGAISSNPTLTLALRLMKLIFLLREEDETRTRWW